MLDFEVIGLSEMRGSSVCYLTDENNEYLTDENGDKVGFEFYNPDSRQGLQAQISQERAKAALIDKTSGIDDADKKLLETVMHQRATLKEALIMMFKSSVGIELAGKKITKGNFGQVIDRLKPHNRDELSKFIYNSENWAVKP